MQEKDALQYVVQQALAAASKAGEMTEFPCIMVPAGNDIKPLESLMKHRNQFRGELRTRRIKDFTDYCNGQDDIRCFISDEEMVAKAFFDMGTIEKPGHCKHSSMIELIPTAANHALGNFNNSTMSQRDLAEFCEDWRDNIRFVDDNGEEMPLGKGIAAIRRVTVESKQTSDTTVKQFGGSSSRMAEINANSGNDALPSFIEFTCVPYIDIDERTFRLRVYLNTSIYEPMFTCRVTTMERDMEEMREEMRAKIIDKLEADEKNVFNGFFKP